MGEVSLLQADEITRTEREAPGTEAALVALAKQSDLSRLRDEARAERAKAVDPTHLQQRQHRARHFRHFIDGLGMVRFSGALPPADGIPLIARIEHAARSARRAARKSGNRPESFDAFAADALVNLLRGSSDSSKGAGGWRAELVVVCDLSAYRRGHAHDGEPCHIVGGGPIPVPLARELAEDAFLKAVLHDGVAISTVRHFGRHIPAELRTALDLGPAPDFDGAACVDCKRRYGLEYDHLDPLANHGATEYANLVPRCYADHQMKTERDREAGRLGRSSKVKKFGVGQRPAQARVVPQRTVVRRT